MAKVALITGGASGIGLATARAFSSKGWTVAIADLKVSVGEEIAEELNGSFYRTNVALYDNLADTFARVWKTYGRLDIVFANAGIVEKVAFYEHYQSDPEGLPPPLDLSIIDTNLSSVIATSYLAIHFFRKNSDPAGCLVITASSGGIYPVPSLPMYGASKHGCVGFMRSLANTLSQEGIRVNCICPGTVATGLLRQDEWDKFPRDTFTPIEKVVEAVEMLVVDDTMYGKAVELIQDRRYLREAPEPSDPIIRENMSTREPLR